LRQVAGRPVQHSSLPQRCPKQHPGLGAVATVMIGLIVAFTSSCSAPQLPAAATAPKLVAKTLNGQMIGLEQLRGHVVLLDFMASWCRPCEKAVPHYVALSAKLRPRGLRIVLISEDEDRPDIVDFVARLGVKLPVAMDPGERWYKAFGVTALPTAVLVDRAGRVRHVIDGGSSPDKGPQSMTTRVDRAVAELLAER